MNTKNVSLQTPFPSIPLPISFSIIISEDAEQRTKKTEEEEKDAWSSCYNPHPNAKNVVILVEQYNDWLLSLLVMCYAQASAPPTPPSKFTCLAKIFTLN